MKAGELKLRIMLLNGEEVESQSAANGDDAEADGDSSGADENSSDGDAEQEEINEEDVERERDRINNRNKLLYNDQRGDEEDEDEVDVFEALKRRREQYLGKKATIRPIETDSENDEAPAKLNSNNTPNNMVATGAAGDVQEQEYEVGDGGDTESLRLRLDDLEDSDENDADDLRNNHHRDDDGMAMMLRGLAAENDDNEGEKENIDEINMTLTTGMRRKKQKIIDSDSEEDETIQTDRFDASLKGDTLARGSDSGGDITILDVDADESSQDVVTQQRRVSKKRERSENDSSDSDHASNTGEDENGPTSKASVGRTKTAGLETQMKVKRKRIVIADDDDDED